MKIIIWKFYKNNKIDSKFWISSVVNYMDKLNKSGIPIFSGLGLSDVASATFGANGVGFVLLQILLLSITGYLINWVAEAMNHRQLGSMAKTVTVLASVTLVIQTIGKLLDKIWQFVA